MTDRTCTLEDCDSPHLARGMCQRHYRRWQRANRMSNGKQRTYTKPCEHCGYDYTTTSPVGRFCSILCHHLNRGAPDSCEVTYRECHCGEWFVWHGRNHCAAPVRTAPPFACVMCGTDVVPGQDGAHWQAHRYCSLTCKRRYLRIRHRDAYREAKLRRRARKRGAFVAPVVRMDIYLRDRWACQLCHKPVNRTATVPDPLAPTLDHIIPLAAGGTHEPSNVQLAHFLCNAQKGDRSAPQPEQLLLVG